MSAPVIPAGMMEWKGGDSAPADWDGGPVLLRDGELLPDAEFSGKDSILWKDDGCSEDIVAYTPRAVPLNPAERALFDRMAKLVLDAAGPLSITSILVVEAEARAIAADPAFPKPPVDALLIEAREIVAKVWEQDCLAAEAEGVRVGKGDNSFSVRATLAALRSREPQS